jgi:hypothetical protein
VLGRGDIGTLTTTVTPTGSWTTNKRRLFVARKNGNGEGSRPRKRADGRWEARYWVDTPTGRKRRSVYGSSRKECTNNLAEAMSAKEEAPMVVPTNLTLEGVMNLLRNGLLMRKTGDLRRTELTRNPHPNAVFQSSS